MAINPENINLIQIRDLITALNPGRNWALSIQDPNSNYITQITVDALGSIIAGTFSMPDGVLNGLYVTINNTSTPKVITVQPGQWRYNNFVYTKNTLTYFNVNPASLQDRIDSLWLTDQGEVMYEIGTPGAGIPNTPPPEVVLTLRDFLVKSDGSAVVTPEETIPVMYAVMNNRNTGDFDITGQFKVNGVPLSLTKATITKSGADVDGNGDLDLSGEDMGLNFTVYVNGISNAYQVQYNKNTGAMSGFYGIDSGDIIEIVF